MYILSLGDTQYIYLVPLHVSRYSSAYFSLLDDMQCVYLVNLRYCTHLMGVLKSVKSADFFHTVYFSFIYLFINDFSAGTIIHA